MPVSYWTELYDWVNSPGLSDGIADFDRPIVPRCLECHATYFASASSARSENGYLNTGFVLGISCERCHGPGRQHVEHVEKERTTASPSKGMPEIVNPSALSRDLQIDVCAQCHGGIGEQLAPAFSYVAGQPLDKFIRLQRPDADARVVTAVQ